MKVAFRTDSSYIIGTGHVYRCLEIAKIFKKKKIDSIFLCSDFDGNINTTIQKNFSLHKISHPSSNLRIKSKKDIYLDAKKTVFFIKKFKINFIFVDCYQINLFWEKIVSKYCKIILITDFINRKTFSDYIINYHLFYEKHEYRKFYLKKNCKRLIGPRYTIVKKFKKKNYKKKNKITVYMGGVDSKGYTEKVVSILKKKPFKNYKILVVIGKKNLEKNFIINKIRKYKNFKYALGTKKNLYDFIKDSSLSISNGGTSMYESLTLGIKTIILPQNQVQKRICKELDSINLISYFKNKKQINSEFILNHLKQRDSKIKQKELVDLYDCYGADRIVDYFTKDKSKINGKLHKAEKIDKFFLYNLFNDFNVVKNSKQKKIINFNIHQKWFIRSLKAKNSKIFVLKYRKLIIGQIRLDKISEKKFKITYSISNEFRGFRQGYKIVKKILQKIPIGTTLVAFVKKYNFISKRIFKKTNFKQKNNLQNKSILRYELTK